MHNGYLTHPAGVPVWPYVAEVGQPISDYHQSPGPIIPPRTIIDA